MKKVSINLTGWTITSSGGRRAWARKVDDVDADGRDGRAIHGDWIDLRDPAAEPGSIVIVCEPRGSVRSPDRLITVGRVGDDGSLDTLAEATLAGARGPSPQWVGLLDAAREALPQEVA